MKIGFTGTRRGMTREQSISLALVGEPSHTVLSCMRCSRLERRRGTEPHKERKNEP